MGGADKLISIIMSDEKLRNSKAFASKIYKDEPILKTAGQLAPRTSGDDIPEKLRELASALRDADFYNASTAQRFCSCAKITEDLEDDYENEEKFVRIFPNYEVMSTEQLRTYFTWRTRVRKGDIRNTYPSYYYLYVYELINQIGVADEKDGYTKLKEVWKAFRKFDSSIDRNMKLWLRDYIVYYGLEKSLTEEVDSPDMDDAVSVLAECDSAEDDVLYEALCKMSTYKTERSSFISEHKDEYRSVICSVFRQLSDYYSKHRARGLCEKLFGNGIKTSYTMFYSALFYDTRKYEEYDYIINSGFRFSCRNGSWEMMRCHGSRQKNEELGNIMHNTDSIMRSCFGWSENFEVRKMTKILSDIIGKAAESSHQSVKKKEELKISFDFSKLEGIRHAAEVTRDKLIVDDEPDLFSFSETALKADQEDKCETADTDVADHEPVKALPSQNECSVSVLDETETEFMRCLLSGRDFRPVLKAAHIMTSVAAESVNEKLFDEFGDTVIDFDGDEPFLIEDYTEELKGMFN